MVSLEDSGEKECCLPGQQLMQVQTGFESLLFGSLLFAGESECGWVVEEALLPSQL